MSDSSSAHHQELCVRRKTPDDGQTNCPKHVWFYSKKIDKLMHLVGFIIRIYHDAHSPERQIKKYLTSLTSHSGKNIRDF